MKKIKTLIVDDSLLFRETLARGIAKDPVIEVVATASDPFMARDKIIEYQPDVMTLDIEMPRMNGIEFLRRLMPQYPLPVVMISALSESVFDALSAGAVDFVAKPNMRGGQALDPFINELILKIKIASVSRVSHWKRDSAFSKPAASLIPASRDRIIAIGASTGGTEAIYQIVKSFSPTMPGTVIVQHMPAGFTRMYAHRLNESCPVEVKEAENGDLILPGQVLIAPGDYQMRLKKKGRNYIVECLRGEKVNGHCPSVDFLFESVAQCAGSMAVGVLLTGMGSDGARGLLAMREKGARTIGQDEASCVVYGMPKVAYDLGAVEKQCPLSRITQTICSLLQER
ncbi:MAG TPA: chemotaxis response regulator protein-glutamate methylesterase [Syntrophomonadaceae bacterium]|nr:chemotaxis response regulator protein-glutamate methylesterase [Syntrophomonadaceae bacterium]